MNKFFFFCSIVYLSTLCDLNASEEPKNYIDSVLENADSFHLQDSILRNLIEANTGTLSKTKKILIWEELGILNLREGLLDEAELALNKAIVLADEEEDKQIKCSIKLANLYLDKGQFDVAVELYLKCIDKSMALNDPGLLTIANGSLAEAYRHYDQYELAMKYNQLALEQAKLTKDEHLLARTYNNLSATLGEMGDNEIAIDSLKSGLRILSEDNFFAKGKFNSNIGFCYRNMGEYDSSLTYHKVALAFKNLGKFEHTYSYSLDAIGRSYVHLGQIDSALYYMNASKELAIKYNNLHRLGDIYKHLSDAYTVDGNYQNAYNYLLKSNEIEDSLNNLEMEQKVLLYQRKFDIAQKEREILELKNQTFEQELKEERRMIFFISLLLLAVISSFAFRALAIKRAKEKDLITLKLSVAEQKQIRDQNALKDFTDDLMQKNKAIRQLNEQLLKKEKEIEDLRSSTSAERQELAEIKILTDEDWQKFKQLFEKVHPSFFSKLNSSSTPFTKGERRLMSLIRLNMENKEMADTLGISSESVAKSRFRLKKKLQFDSDGNLKEYIFNL